MMKGDNLKKITLVLNLNDPYHVELHEWISEHPNGEKRNKSDFIRRLVDHAYQFEKNNRIHIPKNSGGIKLKL